MRTPLRVLLGQRAAIKVASMAGPQLSEVEVVTGHDLLVISGRSRDGLAFRVGSIDDELAAELVDSDKTKIDLTAPTRIRNVLDAIRMWEKDETVPDDVSAIRDELRR
jgi:hypothetical protein